MKRMLSAPNIYLYRECVDFRKSINELAAIIESETDLPLGTGALFLFTNKQRDKVKVLYWDKTGFALWSHETLELDLDEHDKQCSCCQHALHKIGEDRSEKLEFTPAVLKVLEVVRPKYACRQCEQLCESNKGVTRITPRIDTLKPSDNNRLKKPHSPTTRTDKYHPQKLRH